MYESPQKKIDNMESEKLKFEESKPIKTLNKYKSMEDLKPKS